jgi:hypothetical protein
VVLAPLPSRLRLPGPTLTAAPGLSRLRPLGPRRTVAAVLLVASLVLPWVDLQLTGDRRSSGVDIVVPWSSALTAVPFAAAVVTALVLTALTGGQDGHRRAGLVGVGVVTLGLYLPASLRWSGGAVTAQLVDQARKYSDINTSFGLAPTDYTSPSAVLGHPASDRALIIFGSLGLGWYSFVLAGLILASGLSVRASAPPGALGRALLVLLCAFVGSSVVVSAVATGWEAQAAERTVSGDPAAAVSLLHRAQQWDRPLALDPDFVVDVGLANADLGRLDAPSALFARAVALADTSRSPLQFDLYRQALAAAPQNPVVVAGVEEYLAAGTNATYLYTLSPEFPTDPAVQLATGEEEYGFDHFARAITAMNVVVGGTANAWVRSIAYTYMAVAEARLGDDRAFRVDILTAHRLDRTLSNAFASELSAGLYLPGAL